MARRQTLSEFITRIVDRYGLVGEERKRVIDIFYADIVPGLEQVLHECFATETRRGMIATGLARLFTCFPEETRQCSFLDLVDALYDIRDQDVYFAFRTLLINHGLTDAQRCKLVQGIKDRLSEDVIYTRFRKDRESLTPQQFFQLAREALPQDAPTIALQFVRRNSFANCNWISPYNIPRTVPSVWQRRRGLIQLID